MPPEVKSAVDYRREFVMLAIQEGANIRELCRRFQFSSRTGYKWLRRYREGGLAALEDTSRRPHTSPSQLDPALAQRILELRDAHPTWGGRKLYYALEQQGVRSLPAISTITRLLHRTGRIDPNRPVQGPFVRFEHPAANDLWQLDFMGHHPLAAGRVHPLTVLDDHSRFSLTLVACADQRRATVEQHLTACFRRYGLPWAILTDNGPPWGTSRGTGLTELEAWLIRLGIRVVHGRAGHPQTQGKIERFHRTIGQDVFGPRPFATLAVAQAAFDQFRRGYNTERPHQALGDKAPATRYEASPRTFPETLPEIVYGDDDTVHVVRSKGEIRVGGRNVFISQGLAGLPVGMRPTTTEGVIQVRFCQQEVARLDLREPT